MKQQSLKIQKDRNGEDQEGENVYNVYVYTYTC